MLHGQMLTVQMSPRQLTTHTDGLTIKPSKFGWVLTSNIWDMDSYLMLNYRDPKNNNKKMNFANPAADIAASSRSWAQLASWGCSLTDSLFFGESAIFLQEIKKNEKKNDYLSRNTISIKG